jgi:hypothetical protein
MRDACFRAGATGLPVLPPLSPCSTAPPETSRHAATAIPECKSGSEQHGQARGTQRLPPLYPHAPRARNGGPALAGGELVPPWRALMHGLY